MGTKGIEVFRSTARRTWRAGLAMCVVAAALLSSAGVSAHEIGTTRVSVVFGEDRTYDVEIVTDATALADKIASTAGEPLPVDASADRLQSLLEGSDEKFRQRVQLAFEGTEVRPEISFSVAPGSDVASPPIATVRLSGHVPADASHFTWTYSWTFASYSLTVRGAGSEQSATEWLEGGQSSAPMDLAALAPPIDRLEIARRYLVLGFTHIVPYGLDHVLFVLGIYLLSGRARSVLWQVSAFTVAHSITLGLSIYGVISVSPRLVEPLIALSIAYVAVENIFLSELKSWRVALVFAFGLLHGMGFAGVLQELGLPRSEFVTALVTFNLGVEAGQLAVIGAAFLLVGWYCSHRVWYRSRIVVPASVLIACTAAYWTVQRVFF